MDNHTKKKERSPRHYLYTYHHVFILEHQVGNQRKTEKREKRGERVGGGVEFGVVQEKETKISTDEEKIYHYLDVLQQGQKVFDQVDVQGVERSFLIHRLFHVMRE